MGIPIVAASPISRLTPTPFSQPGRVSTIRESQHLGMRRSNQYYSSTGIG